MLREHKHYKMLSEKNKISPIYPSIHPSTYTHIHIEMWIWKEDYTLAGRWALGDDPHVDEINQGGGRGPWRQRICQGEAEGPEGNPDRPVSWGGGGRRCTRKDGVARRVSAQTSDLWELTSVFSIKGSLGYSILFRLQLRHPPPPPLSLFSE